MVHSTDSFKDINDYNIHAKEYSKLHVQANGTLFLAFRDIPGLLEKRLSSGKTWYNLNCVDYGCGAGRSTRFLKSLGAVQVDGFDINQEMLKHAKEFDPNGHYSIIQSGKLPSADNSYDLAFSSFVFVEIGDKNEIFKIYKEIERVLAPHGLFVIVTTTKTLYNPVNHWLTYKILPYPEPLHDGQAVPLRMTDIDFELFDYYWSEEDYLNWGKDSKFSLITKHYPLGKNDEGIVWESESTISPYCIYVFEKTS